MKDFRLLGIEINPQNRQQILEHIKKYLINPHGNLRIVSLNPEILVLAGENPEFKRVIETSQIQHIDGVGVVLAGRLLGIEFERITGVDLMSELVKLADKLRLRVVLIGGRKNLALQLAKCYSQAYAQARFKGIQGIKNIAKPAIFEEKRVFSIVADFKPHIVFTAFGSPWQELWLERHKSRFTDIVVMGVGGAFDFATGLIPRAPKTIRLIGLEWLFRLTVEPWRWKRQLNLIKFVYLVARQKLRLKNPLKFA